MNYRKQLRDKLSPMWTPRDYQYYGPTSKSVYTEMIQLNSNILFNRFMKYGISITKRTYRSTVRYKSSMIISDFLEEKKFKEYFFKEMKRQIFRNTDCNRPIKKTYYQFMEDGLDGVGNLNFLKSFWEDGKKPQYSNDMKLAWHQTADFQMKTYRQGVKDIVENFFNLSDV